MWRAELYLYGTDDLVDKLTTKLESTKISDVTFKSEAQQFINNIWNFSNFPRQLDEDWNPHTCWFHVVMRLMNELEKASIPVPFSFRKWEQLGRKFNITELLKKYYLIDKILYCKKQPLHNTISSLDDGYPWEFIQSCCDIESTDIESVYVESIGEIKENSVFETPTFKRYNLEKCVNEKVERYGLPIIRNDASNDVLIGGFSLNDTLIKSGASGAIFHVQSSGGSHFLSCLKKDATVKYFDTRIQYENAKTEEALDFVLLRPMSSKAVKFTYSKDSITNTSLCEKLENVNESVLNATMSDNEEEITFLDFKYTLACQKEGTSIEVWKYSEIIHPEGEKEGGARSESFNFISFYPARCSEVIFYYAPQTSTTPPPPTQPSPPPPSQPSKTRKLPFRKSADNKEPFMPRITRSMTKDIGSNSSTN